MLNLNKKKFRSIVNSTNAEVSIDTVFNYYQDGRIVWADYSGGSILKGSLIATMDDEGNLSMKYHHLNTKFQLMAGQCRSTPEILSDGRIRFYEKWKWTSGDFSTGESIVEELKGISRKSSSGN